MGSRGGTPVLYNARACPLQHTAQMAMVGALTPLDFALDVCLLQLPKLVTAETMVQYQLPLVSPFFVDSMWGPVFSWLLSQDMIMGVSDMRALIFAKIDAALRNLHTLAIAYEGVPHASLRWERGVFELVYAGLMSRAQPPSPHTTWDDVVHLLSACADLASHVRLFASLGQCVSSKATLLGEMLGVACSEHRGLVVREACLVYKLEGERAFADARRLCVPVPGPVFGPCVGWGVRGASGPNTGDFTRAGCAQPDAVPGRSLWTLDAASDPVADCFQVGFRGEGPSPWSPISPPPGAQPEHRAAAKQGRRRAREGDDTPEVRLAPASRRGP